MSVIFRLLYGYILEKKNLIDNIAKDDMRQINCKSTKCNLIKEIIAVISSLPFDVVLLGSAQVYYLPLLLPQSNTKDTAKWGLTLPILPLSSSSSLLHARKQAP